MNEQDIKIVCGCGREFVWTLRDQEFYREKGFAKPKRCRECVQKRKAEFNKGPESTGYRSARI